MSAPKLRISGPLEAGQSLLGSKNLPSPLTTALEYISNRLARKQLNLSLIVVRRDTQSSPATSEPSSPSNHSATSSPVKSIFSAGAFSRQKTLSRSSSSSSMSSVSDSSSCSSPTGSPRSSSEFERTSPTSPNPYGISLIHACTLTQKEEKALRHYVHKAEKKFSIGTGWLSAHPLTTAITCPRTNDMIRRSLNQNSVLFSSEGLTLYALDHVYTFKCQLHTYSRTLTAADQAAAVDDLHRLILAHRGRRPSRGYLMRAYGWLGVSRAALVDVNERYRCTYGGPARLAGIDMVDEDSRSPPPLKTAFHPGEIRLLGGMRSAPAAAPVTLRPVSPAVEKPAPVREDRGPHARGPVTPNSWEDITPVTKGEWLCLMVGEKWREARTAPVVSCFE